MRLKNQFLKKLRKGGLALFLVLLLGLNSMTSYAMGDSGTLAAQSSTESRQEEKSSAEDAEIPAEVQAFLDAVAQIPAQITADNAAEAAEYVYGSVSDAYEILLGTDYMEREDVQNAEAVMADAIKAVDAALNMEASNYAWCPAPRDTTAFPCTDGTSISVLQWDFENIKHPRDYHLYLEGKTGSNGESCFERYYANNDFTPTNLATRTVAAGDTAVFGYRPTAANFTYGGYYIPSVYLYMVDEVEGVEWIEGGAEAIQFYASEDKGMTGLWPYTNPSEPHIRMNVPIKADATTGSTIVIKFRLAYGFDCDWNAYNYQSLGDEAHRKDNYYWRCEDFVYTLTVKGSVSGSTPEPAPAADYTTSHDLYIPAGYSATISLSKAYNSNHTKAYLLSEESYVQGDQNVAVITGNEIGYEKSTWGNGQPVYDDVTIKANAGAKVGDETEVYVMYKGTYQSSSYTFKDVITVHIVDVQDVQLQLNEDKTILPNKGTGTISNTDAFLE